MQWWDEWLYIPLCWRSLPPNFQVTSRWNGRYYGQSSHVSFNVIKITLIEYLPKSCFIVFTFLFCHYRCAIYRLPDAHKHITRPPAGVIFPKKVCLIIFSDSFCFFWHILRADAVCFLAFEVSLSESLCMSAFCMVKQGYLNKRYGNW